MSALRRLHSSSPPDDAADVGVFRERRHRGRHMANPRITNAHRGWRGVRSSSILRVEDILLPRWMSSRSAQIPVIGTHTHCSSLQRRARMTGCAAVAELLVIGEAAIIGTSADSGRADASAAGRPAFFYLWFIDISKFPANSLLFAENSLLGVQKFPAPLRREFGCKPMDSLAEWRRKLANEPKIFENSLQIPC